VAAVIQTYLDTAELCHEKILVSSIIHNRITDMASEYFAKFGIEPDTMVDPSNFFGVVGRVLNLTEIETNQLHKAIFASERGPRPIYFFFTYFDMVLSTIEGTR
jgi:hypothetical protein